MDKNKAGRGANPGLNTATNSQALNSVNSTTNLIKSKKPGSAISKQASNNNSASNQAHALGGATNNIQNSQSSLVPSFKDTLFTEAEARAAPLTPRCIVDGYLYADLALLAAPGGVGKTTIVFYEMIHIVLGKDLYGLKVKTPGKCLFVTAEDSKETCMARILRLMNALNLNKTERNKVYAGLGIWDVTGRPCRLVEFNNGAINPSPLVDEITMKYKSEELALIVFDPVISFGSDEERVNTNADGLVQAARRIIRALGCCVRYISHTGQEAARNKNSDQYAVRSGTALPDGARMVAIMHANPDIPSFVDHWVTGKRSIVRLTMAKLSYAKKDWENLWLGRDGYDFEHLIETPAIIANQNQAKINNLDTVLLTFLRNSRAKWTRNQLIQNRQWETVDNSFTRASMSQTINRLLSDGRLVNNHLPKPECQGGRKTHLLPC